MIRTGRFALAAAFLLSASAAAWGQVVANGNGLRGEYYPTNNFTGTVDVRLDQGPIDIDYVATGPGGAIAVVDNFSTRWRGQVESPVDGPVTFQTDNDDQARLWVGGVQIINSGGGTPTATPIT